MPPPCTIARLTRQPSSQVRPTSLRYSPRSVQPANVFLLFIPSRLSTPLVPSSDPHFLFPLSARRRHDECHICRFIFVHGRGIQFCGGVCITGFLNGYANIIWTVLKYSQEETFLSRLWSAIFRCEKNKIVVSIHEKSLVYDKLIICGEQ